MPSILSPRPTCSRCRRPTAFCWCRLIEPVTTATRLVFLQHHRESRVRIGTARMAHLGLTNSEFHVGMSCPVAPGPRTAVLFPGADALPPSTLGGGDPWTLIVVDGTWSQARKLVERDPVLRNLPRIGFEPARPGNYRIRREPSPSCLATVEAVAEVLGQVEGFPERFASMLTAFTHMVDLQIEAAGVATARRRVRTGPPPIDAGLRRLRQAGERLVLLHAEANAHPRRAGVPGRAELVHLVALRRATGQRFEAVLAPRRPLAAATPWHIGLDPLALLGGEEPEAALSRFRAFLQDQDVLVTWGPYPIDLLEAEGIRTGDSLDVRRIVARRLGRKPGPIEQAHGEIAPESFPGLGRAGRKVASLAAVAALLAA